MRAWFANAIGLAFSALLSGSSPDVHSSADSSLRVRLEKAEQIYRVDGAEMALPHFEALASEAEAAKDAIQHGTAVHFLGEIHWRLGNYDQAADYLNTALGLRVQSGERLHQAKTLNVLGLLNWDLGDYAQAKAYFAQATEIAQELGDKRLQGALLNNLSLVHDEMGDYRVSLTQYQRVLDLYSGIDFPRGTGDTLGNIGGVYLLLGRYREALDYYQKALAISEQLDSTASMSQDHGNIALCYLHLGLVDTALDHFDKAIELSLAAGMLQDQAFWLRQKGNAFITKGHYDRGLENHRGALGIYQELDGKTELAEALHDMGQLHLLLGDPTSASGYFRQAIELSRQIGLSRGITINLLALGDLQLRRGALEEAAAFYGQAITRARESGEMTHWSTGLLRLAVVQQHQGRLHEAMESAGQALKFTRETGAFGLEAHAIYIQAELNRLQGKLEPAIQGFELALSALATSPSPELAWQVHYRKGLALAESGNKSAAIDSLQLAITFIEGVRNRLHEERFRAGYVQDKYQVYVDLVRLQLEIGKPEDAFSTAERLRARSFMEMLDNGQTLQAGDESQLAEYAMKERIRTLREALTEEAHRSRPDQRELAISVYSQELVLAEQDYHALLDDRRRTGRDSRTTHIPTYQDVRSGLTHGEALVEYVVGADSVILFVITRDALSADAIQIRREDLDNKVELVRDLIRRQDSDRWRKPAASLASALIDPVLKKAQVKDVDHLYLVPHGTLNYLPFAMLPITGSDQPRPIIANFTLTYLPTASALFRKSGSTDSPLSMLAVAPLRSRLHHASEEVRAVNALFAPNSKAMLGTSATESAFREEASEYGFLHLATHGYFNKLNPLLSGLELEADNVNDGQLELHEILGMQLDAELVTLSACQTGLGSGHFTEVPAGDDFVGLTRAFLYAGSRSVLATLWEVNDTSTMGFMKNFYGELKRAAAHEDKATALANAQRAFLSSEDYRHPYFWAPFVLVGAIGRENYAGS